GRLRPRRQRWPDGSCAGAADRRHDVRPRRLAAGRTADRRTARLPGAPHDVRRSPRVRRRRMVATPRLRRYCRACHAAPARRNRHRNSRGPQLTTELTRPGNNPDAKSPVAQKQRPPFSRRVLRLEHPANIGPLMHIALWLGLLAVGLLAPGTTNWYI